MSKAGATRTVGGIALLAMAASGWVFVLSPRTSALAEVREQVKEVRAQNDALEQQVKLLRAREARLADVRRTALALGRKFPATADQPRFFREVTAAAVEAGIPEVKLTTLTPAAPVAGQPGTGTGVKLPGESTSADLARQTVTMSVEGTLDQLQRLMNNLEQMPRAYLITSLTVGQGSDAQLYNASINGEMFVLPAVPDPKVATPTGGSTGTQSTTGTS